MLWKRRDDARTPGRSGCTARRSVQDKHNSAIKGEDRRGGEGTVTNTHARTVREVKVSFRLAWDGRYSSGSGRASSPVGGMVFPAHRLSIVPVLLLYHTMSCRTAQ